MHGRDTGRSCPWCDDGRLYKIDGDIVCDSCFYSPEKTLSEPRDRDRWQWFWDARDRYSGWYGPDRIRMVGGFIGAYP